MDKSNDKRNKGTLRQHAPKIAIAAACVAVLMVVCVGSLFSRPVSLNSYDMVSAGNENVSSDTKPVTLNGNNQAGDKISSSSNASSSKDDSGEELYVPNTILVGFVDGYSADNAIESISSETGITGITVVDKSQSYVKLGLPESVSVESAVQAFSSVGAIDFAQPDFIYYTMEDSSTAADGEGQSSLEASSSVAAGESSDTSVTTQSTTTDDSRLSEQWALSAVRAYDAWDTVRTNKAVSVAVIDDMFDVEHVDLKNNIVAKYNAIEKKENSNMGGSSSHGTHVAGIVAAEADNNEGVAGVSYNAGLVLIRAADDNGSFTSSTLIDAYDYLLSRDSETGKTIAEKYNVRVINMSLGGIWTGSSSSPVSRGSDQLLKKVDDALNAGIVTVAAAGNAGNYEVDGKKQYYSAPFDCYPGDYKNIISVINVDSNGNRAASSNYNVSESKLYKNISAPGQSILSTISNNSYGNKPGTSMAAPCVSGAMALLFAVDPNLTPSDAVSKLYSTAKDLNTGANLSESTAFDLETGYGEVDAYALVESAAAKLSGATSMEVGSSETLTITPAQTGAWTWTSSDNAVATVSGDARSGVVTGVAPGVITITATNGASRYAVQEMAVYDPTILDSTNEKIGDDGIVVGVGSNVKTQLKVSGDNPSGTWRWSSSNTAIAVVNQSGVVTGVSEGEAEITVTLVANPEISDTVKVFVEDTGIGNGNLYYVTSYFFGMPVEYVKLPDVSMDQIYTGSKITLSNLAVAYNGRWLRAGRDYTIEYKDNVDVGIATVTVTGAGSYYGELSSTFRIGTKKIVDCKAKTNYDYTGNPVELQGLTVKDNNGDVLEVNKDYTIVYSNNVDVGTATCTIRGIGDCVGGIEDAQFTINPVSIASDAVTVSGIVDKPYTGSSITQTPVLTYNGKKLVLGKDYSLSYQNNVNAGTATMVFQGIGNFATNIVQYSWPFSYTTPVTRAETFTITKADLAQAQVAINGWIYDGSAHEPTPTVMLNGRTLVASEYSVSYSGNKNAGTCTATITPTDTANYSGTATGTCTVAKAQISAASIASVGSQTYTGSAIEPSPAVTFNGKTLSKGSDYTLSYKNNVNVGTATIVVEGQGNFTGTKSTTFTIISAPSSTSAPEQNKTQDSTDNNQQANEGQQADQGSQESPKAQDTPETHESSAGTISMYRLYNANSGEHFYTADASERATLINVGWNDEGFAWTAPETSNTPVYRMYNPVAGEHHFTTGIDERNLLVEAGWNYEGIGWYSDDAQTVPLYRDYNPNAFANNHNYTTNIDEHNMLISVGWREEGIAWYGV